MRRPVAQGLLTIVCVASASACATDRYLGSIGRDGTYGNRGFGIAVISKASGLSERWEPLDAKSMPQAPDHLRPELREEALDVDADGELELSERRRFTKPMLRLLSRTSTSVVMDVDAEILGGALATAPLDAIVASELKRRASSGAVAEALASLQKKRLGPDFDARVLEFVDADENGVLRFERVAFIDQPDFIAEEKIVRRQLVVVRLVAPRKSKPLVADHDLFLKGVILSQKGGSERGKEKW